MQLRALAEWLIEREVDEVVMESTAQYWRPVWAALERALAAARAGRAAGPARRRAASGAGAVEPRAARTEARFPDAERLVKRLVAQELTLSFVPDAEQRLWRTVTRRKFQLTATGCSSRTGWSACSRTAHLKLSSLVSDLLGLSARRMLRASRMGPTTPRPWPPWQISGSHATPDQLRDALGACTELQSRLPRLLQMVLDELEVIERHIHQLDEELAQLLRDHQDAVERLAAVPGLGVDSAQQIIAEVGPTAATFPTAKRSPPGWAPVPATMRARASTTAIVRRTAIGRCAASLNQAANAAVKAKGSIFELVYRRLVVRLGHAKRSGRLPTGSVASCGRSCTTVSRTRNADRRLPNTVRNARAAKMIRGTPGLGYRVEQVSAPASALT